MFQKRSQPFRLACLGLLLALGCVHPARAADESPAQVTLVPTAARVAPGRSLSVAIVFKIQPHWHTYWLNPGTAGESARVTWDLPEGWKDEGLRFPVPDRVEQGDVVIFGYEGSVTLLSTLSPPPTKISRPVTLAARLSYLACKDVCLGDEKNFHLVVSSGTPGRIPLEVLEAEKDIPADGSGLDPTLRRGFWGGWSIETKNPLGPGTAGEFTFYPLTTPGVDFSEVSKGRSIGDRLRFSLQIDRNQLAGDRVEGVIRQKGSRGGWRVGAPVGRSLVGGWMVLCLVGIPILYVETRRLFGRRMRNG